MMKKLLSTLFILALPLSIFAQLGGEGIMKFIFNPPSARITGLGGNAIATRDDDPTGASQNPALLNAEQHNKIAFSHRFFYNGIQDGYVSYARQLRNPKLNWHVAMQYATYGDIIAADQFGTKTGTVSAGDYAVTTGISYPLYDRLSIGANVRFASSRLDQVNANALMTDLGACYHIDDKNLSLVFVIRNVGVQLNQFNDKNEVIPYEIQAGISKRLKYLPFRYSIIYTNLQRWNVLYDDPNAVDDGAILFGDNQSEGQSKTSIYFDNLFRHLHFSGEFLIGKKENLRVRLGYNHLLRKEMQVKTFRSLAGFSGGLGIKINRFRLDYGTQAFHLVGRTHHLTLSTDLDWFMK